jgi:hypothetical protein
MSYIGGKARGSSHILAVLNHARYDGMDYLEPFVGMGHVLRRVTNAHAVAAHQYSFNGRLFGGYVSTYERANGTVDDIPDSRARYYNTLRASPPFARATLSHCDYRAHTPTQGCLVYTATRPTSTQRATRARRRSITPPSGRPCATGHATTTSCSSPSTTPRPTLSSSPAAA